MIISETDLKGLFKKRKDLIFLTPVFVYSGPVHAFSNGFSISAKRIRKERPDADWQFLRYSLNEKFLQDPVSAQNDRAFSFERPDLERLSEKPRSTWFVSALFSKLIPTLTEELIRLSEPKTIIFGGPGVHQLLFLESESAIRKRVYQAVEESKTEVFFFPFNLDVALFGSVLSEFSFYFEEAPFEIKRAVASIPQRDYCWKLSRHGRCLFCSFDCQMRPLDFESQRPRDLKKMFQNLERRRDFDVSLFYSPSGPPLSEVIRAFEAVRDHLEPKNLSFASAFVFTPSFRKVIAENREILFSREAGRLNLDAGIETLIDSVRRDLNKQYVSSREAIELLLFLLENSAASLTVNLILNVRPLTRQELEEFKRNLLHFLTEIDRKGWHRRVTFCINVHCEYFGLERLEKVRRGNDWPFRETAPQTYVFRLNKYSRKLIEAFIRLKERSRFRIELADLSEKSLEDLE